MEAPLSHYYMFTGHNSYLTGNQLSSDSSEVPIIEALHHGVRVIELDLWPNNNQNDIKVCHGGYYCIDSDYIITCLCLSNIYSRDNFYRTLTAPVDLIKCLRAIKEHAFVASEYPVVITFEDHLTPNLQSKVAQVKNQLLCMVDFTL